jgi:hypothetical protein
MLETTDFSLHFPLVPYIAEYEVCCPFLLLLFCDRNNYIPAAAAISHMFISSFLL